MDDGSLESFESDLDDSRYIAISHVWSRAQWTKIPGIPFEVLVSPHKARYIMKRLPALVRNLPFWMDVLCVDQKSKAARIAVVNSIPEIYRQAIHTLSIKDGDGIRDCCLRSISTFSDWSRHGSTELLNHIAKKHFADGLTETYLDRVWPLEEAFLSDVIQFDMCEENQPERPSYHSGDYMLRASVDAQRIIASIHSLGYTWIGHGVDGRQASESRFEEFVKAFITNGVISRPPAASKPLEVSSRDNLLYQLHLNSTRKTGKPRDFVFAIMSKYEWYTVPARGGDMTFPELFLDCHKQACGAGMGFNCKFVSSLWQTSEGMDSWIPSSSIPTPQTLGDFLKLLGPAQAKRSPLTIGLLANTVPYEDFVSVSTMAEAINVIESTMRFSALNFHLSHEGGELSKYGRYRAEDSDYPEDFVERGRYGTVGTETDPDPYVTSWLLPEAYVLLDTLWLGLGLYFLDSNAKAEAFQAKRMLIEKNPPAYKETMLMLAAIVSCGLPMSSFVWTKHRFIDQALQLGEFKVLCLLSVPRLRTLNWPIHTENFYAVERLQEKLLTGKDVFLTTSDGAAIGILPDADAVDDDNVYLDHMRALHYQIYVGKDGQLALNKVLYVGQDTNGIFRVGVESEEPEAPWVRNWDTESKYVEVA